MVHNFNEYFVTLKNGAYAYVTAQFKQDVYTVLLILYHIKRAEISSVR